MFILVDYLPEMQKQIEDNIVGWMGWCLEITQFTIQLLEELEIAAFFFIGPEVWLQKQTKSTYLTNPQFTPIHFKRLVGTAQTLSGLRKQEPFPEELKFFLCAFEM